VTKVCKNVGKGRSTDKCTAARWLEVVWGGGLRRWSVGCGHRARAEVELKCNGGSELDELTLLDYDTQDAYIILVCAY
jgi:hypothetical protein